MSETEIETSSPAGTLWPRLLPLYDALFHLDRYGIVPVERPGPTGCNPRTPKALGAFQHHMTRSCRGWGFLTSDAT